MRFEMNWQGKLRNMDKNMKCPTLIVREEVVGNDMSAYGLSNRRTEQSHRKRVGGIGVHIYERSLLKRVRMFRRVGETVDINDNELERARPIHLLETLQNITKAQTQLDVCVKKGGIRQMLGLKS